MTRKLYPFLNTFIVETKEKELYILKYNRESKHDV